MMQKKMLVQSLRGSKAQVMWAFYFARCAMSVEEVVEWTGLKRETATAVLAGLAAVDLLGRQVLAHNKFVYVLGGDMLFHLGEVPALAEADFQLSTKRTSGNPLIIIKNEFDLESVDSVNNNNKSQLSTKRTSEDLVALLAALKSFGVVGKKKAELLECEWVTAEYLIAHILYAKAEKVWNGHHVGMAITRMLDELPQPELNENGHVLICECSECKEDLSTYFGDLLRGQNERG